MAVDKGLLLLNLGSPVAPRTPEVRRYLAAFLTDPYVIDLPWPLRQLLVRGWIAPRRAPLSAEAYHKIWLAEGSPLLHFSRLFGEAVKRRLAPEWDVRLAMRYGEPALSAAVRDWKVSRVYVLPLYPQYAESSTRSALEAAFAGLAGAKFGGEIFFLNDFYDQGGFLDAQARRISEAAAEFRPDHVLLSFHGLPEHHMARLHPGHCLRAPGCCDTLDSRNRLCYRAQCFATARGLSARLDLADLDLPSEKISVSFQSRLGRRPWIKPYTDHVIEELASAGVRRVLVSCPSFVADCLETLEEVGLRLRRQFIAAGGEDLALVPALNAEDFWIESFCRMVGDPKLRWRRKGDACSI
jgi:ferrochelatase